MIAYAVSKWHLSLVYGPWDREFSSDNPILSKYPTTAKCVKLTAKLASCDGNVVVCLKVYRCVWWFVCVLKVCQQALLSSHLHAKNLLPAACLTTHQNGLKFAWPTKKDVLLRSSIPTLKENVLWDLLLLTSFHAWGCLHTCYIFSVCTLTIEGFSPPPQCLHHVQGNYGIISSLWLELCLQSPRWDWIMEYFMKSCLLPNNSLKFQHLLTSHLLSQIRGPPFPSLLCRREVEEKFEGSLSQLFSPALKVLGYGGLCFAPLLSLAVLQCWWSRKAAQIIQGSGDWNHVICALWELETWDGWVLFFSQGQSGEFACPGVLDKCPACFPMK